jgi:glycosyltransferase involved in cell wall biosynthesis
VNIALVDNMNNNFFALARYLRDLGTDVDLYLIPGAAEHFHPQCDTFEDVSTMTWVKTFPTSYQWYKWLAFKKTSYDMFKRYDLVVACGYAMGMLRKCGVQPDVFIPFGTDLIHIPFWSERPGRGNVAKRLMSIPMRMWISRWQREAIRDVRLLVSNPSHGLYADALKKLGKTCVNMNVPMVYNTYAFPRETNWDELAERDFVVFNHSRHIWRSNPDGMSDFAAHGGNKRNDKGIRAFAKFVRTTSFRSPVFVTFEYGPDVAHSKDLVAALGIEKHVIWKPLSERRQIMHGLRHASLALDQFRHGLSGIGGVGYEVMASGVPLLTHTNGAAADATHPFYGAPIVDVLEEDEIFDVFVDCERNPHRYRALGLAGKKWFDNNIGVGLVQRYHELFHLLCGGKELTQESVEVRQVCRGSSW